MNYDSWEQDYKTHREAYLAIFDECMSTNNIEKTTFPTLGRKYGVPVASATDALQFSLMAHGIGPGDEVLVSDFSWISSSSCISMVGATPAFCDINLDTYTISLDSIKKMTGPATKALVYTHLFGDIADDVQSILDYCKLHNIIFIEDAAQSLGSNKNGMWAGTLGDCSSFSFNSNKVVAGINGGGVFLTDDQDKASYVRKVSRHGNNEFLGRNSKAYLLNTEIIKYRLSHAKEDMRARQLIAQIYNEELKDEVNLPQYHVGHNYHKYVIRYETKEQREIARGLTGFKSHYSTPLSDNIMYNSIDCFVDNCVNSKIAADTVLSLPIHAYMTEDDAHEVVDKILMVI